MDKTTVALSTYRCIPMLKQFSLADFPHLLKAFKDSGVRTVNVSQQIPDGLALLKAFVEEGSLLAGAGNVRTCQQAEAALDAGAAFIFSPIFDEKMVQLCKNRSIPIYPVALNAELALKHMLKTLGCFPVEQLGSLLFIDRLAAEGGFSFFVAGGIGEDMMEYYLDNPNVLGMTGSWMFRHLGDWKAITEDLARTKHYWRT